MKKSNRALALGLALGAVSATAIAQPFTPPKAPVCTDGMPNKAACELTVRAHAACKASKSTAEFDACVKKYGKSKETNRPGSTTSRPTPDAPPRPRPGP